MFKLEKLVLIDFKGKSFCYFFREGINFFKGTNASGKTEFYKFIDYMLGANDEKISEKKWFEKTLKWALMQFEYRGIKYLVGRELVGKVAYFKYLNEKKLERCTLEELCDRLNAIFASDKNDLQHLREFVEEDFSFRAFTLFNFYGEKSLGRIRDFFDKCINDIKYSIKLPLILDYIFNKQQEEILRKKKILEGLEVQFHDLEGKAQSFEFVLEKINHFLRLLNVTIEFDGRNQEKIVAELNRIKEMEKPRSTRQRKSVAELETILNNLDDQIKIAENRTRDTEQIQIENENRKMILDELKCLIEDKAEFEYLIEPIYKISNNLDKSISFSKYYTNTLAIKKLKEQRDDIKKEIGKDHYRFSSYNLTEKVRALATVEELINVKIENPKEKLRNLKKQIRDLKAEIKELLYSKDEKKLSEFSDFVTRLYSSAKNVSSFVKSDFKQDGFRIKYFYKGNSLQPQVLNEPENPEKIFRDVEVGSLARHTLIQLCGYLAFLRQLVLEEKVPIIPILVIDHISKPFDKDNLPAVGKILEEFYKHVLPSEIQIIMFDDENFEDLSIIPNKYDCLFGMDKRSKNKSGFNPFYTSISPD